ncbi:MAG: BamA/TamA family outer membrane protein [Polyangiaceae bacterium]|jgi:outer membrane protein insertion porin family
MPRRLASAVFAALVAFAALVHVSAAWGQPLHTWGAKPQTAPADSSTPTTPSEPPPPPPSTLGTPVEPPAPVPAPTPPVAPPSTPPADDAASSSIVRSPGHVGLRYTLEGIEVRGNTTTLSRVILRYIPYRPGDTLDVDDKEIELTRFRLLGTGFFRDVNLSLRRGSQRGNVILVVSVVERNTIVLNNVWLGLATDANPDGSTRPITAYGGVDVSETNLAGTGIMLGGAIVVADNQVGLRARVADHTFLGTSWTLEAQFLYNHAEDFFGNKDVVIDDPTQQVLQDYAVVQYDRFGGSLGVGHDLGISSQIFLNYRLEGINATLPLAASDHRGLDIEPIDFYILPGSSILSTLSANVVFDTRDEPVLTKSGDYVSALAEASLSPLGSDYPYAKLQVRAQHFTRLPWGHVLKLDAFAGAIFGNAPLFEKFYVGDFSDLLPDRALDLNFDRRTAPNYFNTDIVEIRYGQYAAEINAEYRVPIYHGTRSIYGVDLFGSVGVYGDCNDQDITNPARGYTGFATIPIDFTFNFGLRADTAMGGVLFGISNFIGFLPVSGGASQ